MGRRGLIARGCLRTYRRCAAATIAVAAAAAMVTACGSSSGSGSGGGSSSSAGKGPIVVSQLAGSSGAYAIVGKEVFGGAQMAVDKINSSGGVMGRKIQLTNYNDGGSATQANEQFRHALSAHSVVVMGSPDEGSVVASLAQRYKIPDMGEVDEGALTVYPDGPSKPPLSWVWSNTLDGFGLGHLIADWTMKNCKAFAILHDPTTYGKGGDDGMRLAYQQADKLSQIVVDDAVSEDWSSGTPVSLTTEISKIKQAGADCVELWLTPQDEAAFATSAAHLGDHFTILGSDNMTSTNIFQQLAGKYANGALAPQLTSVVKNSPAIVAFDKAFRAKYHVEASVNAYGAYMGMFILARAIETAKGSTSPTAIQASLNKLKNFSGLMGTISYSPKLHTAIQPGQLTLERWNAGPKTWTSVFTGGSQ